MEDLEKVKNKLEQLMPCWGVNKQREILRLLLEISQREKRSPETLLHEVIKERYKKLDFQTLKATLLQRRFPRSPLKESLNKAYLPKIKSHSLSLFKFSPFFKFSPEEILYETELEGSPFKEQIANKFPKARLNKIKTLKDYIKTSNLSYNYNDRTKRLFLVRELYDFVKRCPCTKNAVHCEYLIFNLGFGCIFECTFCYLQHYTNQPGIILAENLDDYLNYTALLLKERSLFRIGSGEFTDSLALDNITLYSKRLVSFFKDKSLFFEFKTKSREIDNLLKLNPSRNIVVSWSLNPQSIIDTEEYYTASLKERLESAKMCYEAGYGIGFHFDPIIETPQWEELYQDVIENIYQIFAPSQIWWISLGTLRFHRGLKQIAELRFPQSNIFLGELLISKEDGKLRYPAPIRVNMYKKMLTWLRQRDQKVWIYLCMEKESIWREVFREQPKLWPRARFI